MLLIALQQVAQINPHRIAEGIAEGVHGARVASKGEDFRQLIHIHRMAGGGWAELVLQGGGVTPHGGSDGSSAAWVLIDCVIQRERQRQNLPLGPLQTTEYFPAHGITPQHVASARAVALCYSRTVVTRKVVTW